jgi:hypothetical protein
MKALRQDVSGSVPSLPVARLVGHDGPVQAVCFTGRWRKWYGFIRNLTDETYFSRLD